MADFSSCYGDSTIRITQHINILEVGVVNYADHMGLHNYTVVKFERKSLAN